MNKTLEFFYDYVSVYSYLADSQLAQLAGADIVYRPMFLGAVMQATGNRPPGTIEAKRKYLHDDIARWAERYQLSLTMNPHFPQNTLNALRLAIVAQKEGCFAAVHRRLFDAMWVDQANLEDTEFLQKLAGDSGLGAQASMRATASQAVKEQLKSNTEEAVSRGVFGAPTFFLGKQMFFGNDRFDFIRQAIG
ncbi:MAG: 2-hydroxychromene-2-carboxylate isomerase [Gammaproteobacteria bacterium]|nr:2-hydroxychromene-2-carboxylate isomerase [Gammaproteobacteria bacterium]MDH4315225.1 2-hydroxychromene-2-carboxylate isomerase [Gammaproteobacteria bacterium]MDH5215005.1 2-hydroxychromene-2-carboxylate isomerase [Gammaproteobacteria bacterium]MDH5501315.1 2-hydroxychromene-2-carboxylate isomerase [Gammaproteobacteria bacterium]